MANIINKEDFVNVLQEVKKTFDYNNELNNFLRKNGADGYIFQPDCSSSTLRLLHLIFKNEDIDNLIEYFCFELDFGKKWKPEMVKEKDGTDIKLETIEDLYDFLCKNK